MHGQGVEERWDGVDLAYARDGRRQDVLDETCHLVGGDGGPLGVSPVGRLLATVDAAAGATEEDRRVAAENNTSAKDVLACSHLRWTYLNAVSSVAAHRPWPGVMPV